MPNYAAHRQKMTVILLQTGNFRRSRPRPCRENRTELRGAIADMIRDRLVEHRQKFGNEEIGGTITLVYDHRKPHLQTTLTDIQHNHRYVILSIVYVHLDHHNCLEVLLVRSRAAGIKKLPLNLLTPRM
jgi:CopG family nickel-responsive transcriptional regulator